MTNASATTTHSPAATDPAKRDHLPWSFQPVSNPVPPVVKKSEWPRSAIDRFVLARLEEKGWHPHPRLTRRPWFDAHSST